MTDRELLQATHALQMWNHDALRGVYTMSVVGLCLMMVVLVLKVLIYVRLVGLLRDALGTLAAIRAQTNVVRAERQMAAVTLGQVRQSATEARESAAAAHEEVRKAGESGQPTIVGQPVTIQPYTPPAEG